MARVLIVEDDHLMQNILQTKFTSQGYQVLILPNVEGEFINKVKDFNPNIILMDVELCPPSEICKSGIDGVGSLKEDSSTKDIPVIFITNRSDDETKNKAAALNPKAYLIKAEQTPAEIVEKVSAIIGK